MGKLGFRHTAATKRKLSKLRTGANNPFYGRAHTDDFKQRLSARTKVMNAKRQYEIGPRSLPEITEVQAAYFAGIVDGEGSISKRPRAKAHYITICNTNYDLMKWLMVTTKRARVYRRKIQKDAVVKARSEIFVWEVTGTRDVYYLLTRMRPYMTIKAARADAAIDLMIKSYGKDRLDGRND